jgi:parallel beta-helix repeat protein
VLAVLAVGAPAPAEADPRVFQVHPGPNAIQSALAAAHANDILNLHAGVYRVPNGLTVNKPIVIRSAGDGVVTIDGRCQVGFTIDVNANNVRLRGLRVVGADEGFDSHPAEVFFSFVTTGEVSGSVAANTCGGAEYGISVFNSGPIKVLDNTAFGFDDSGIYIGGIVNTGDGTLMVRGNRSRDSMQGIIVENSSGTIAVVDNRVRHNLRDGPLANAGIYVRNSDGVRIRDNAITNNGADGIVLDPTSDLNRVIGNTLANHDVDLRNQGSGNCFTGNTFATSEGDVSDPC